VRDQAKRFQSCLKRFARDTLAEAGTGAMRRATFVLAEVPVAAVKPHLQVGEPPPAIVDELISTVYRAIVIDRKGAA
jgi:hypothetical protein